VAGQLPSLRHDAAPARTASSGKSGECYLPTFHKSPSRYQPSLACIRERATDGKPSFARDCAKGSLQDQASSLHRQAKDVHCSGTKNTSETLAAAEDRPPVSNLAGRPRVRLSADVRIMQSPRRKPTTYVLIALAILVLLAIPIWLSTGPAVLAPGSTPEGTRDFGSQTKMRRRRGA
jgi:hypothetical protein